MRRQFEMPPFVEQMQVEIAEQRSERVRILGLLHRVWPRDAQQVRLGAGYLTDEQAGGAIGASRPSVSPLVRATHLHFQRSG